MLTFRATNRETERKTERESHVHALLASYTVIDE